MGGALGRAGRGEGPSLAAVGYITRSGVPWSALVRSTCAAAAGLRAVAWVTSLPRSGIGLSLVFGRWSLLLSYQCLEPVEAAKVDPPWGPSPSMDNVPTSSVSQSCLPTPVSLCKESKFALRISQEPSALRYDQTGRIKMVPSEEG